MKSVTQTSVIGTLLLTSALSLAQSFPAAAQREVRPIQTIQTVLRDPQSNTASVDFKFT